MSLQKDTLAMMKTLGLPAGAGAANAATKPKTVAKAAPPPAASKKGHQQQPKQAQQKPQKPQQSSSHRPFVVPSLSSQPKAVAPQKAAVAAPSSSSSSSSASTSSASAPPAPPKKIHHVDKHGKLVSNKPPAPQKTASNGKPGPAAAAASAPAKGNGRAPAPPKPAPVQKDVKRKWWSTPSAAGNGKGAAAEQLVAAPAEDGAWYASTTPTPGLLTIESLVAAEAASDGDGDSAALATVDDKTLTEVVAAVGAAYARECVAYQQGKRGRPSADRKWINDVLEAGTVSDKVAALALTVQESPVHELAALDDLIALAGKKEHRTAQLALEALKDLLVHNLLPDRQLRKFRTQPLAHPSMAMPSALLFWYEDQLLTRMDRVADALELGLKSTLDFFKKKCMEVAADLLVSKPQHEGRFLAMLVNKLGDPSGAVSTKAIELLRTVVRKQPPMKCVVVREVRQLIHRPNLSVRAVHSGIVFLSQVPLMPVGDRDVAAQLVEGYMGLFEKAIAEETLGSRLLSTLLSGLDRAFPALGGDVAPVVKHVDALFRIVHSEAFTTSVRALVLISRIALGDADDSSSSSSSNSRGKNGHGKKGKGKRKGEGKGPPADTAQADESEQGITTRFYRALYAKLLSPQVSTRAYNTLFLNLLYRSMKRDPSTRRVMAFVKRLGLCALQSSPPVAAGLLFLTAEVCRARPALRAVMQGVDSAEPSSSSSSSDPATAAPPRVEDDDDEAAAHSLGNFEASKREPLYAVAEGAVPAAWEASLLAQHYHPSVQTFASSLLSTQRIAFAGDPTKDFSLSAFLNRFAYKNPKKQHAEKIRGSGVDAAGASAGEEPINTSAFLRTSAADVAPDKKFFYKFFGEQEKLRAEGKSKDRSRRKKGSDGDDDDGEGDDEEEEMDAFAQKLAEDMMKDGGDPDMDDFSDDDLDDDDDDDDEEGEEGDVGDDDEDADGDVFRSSEGLGQFDDDEDDDEDDEDDGDGNEEEEDDDEGDDGYKLTAYGDDDEDGDGEEEDDGDDGDDDDGEDDDDDDDGNDGEDEDDLAMMFGDGDGPRGGKRKASEALRSLGGKRSSKDGSDFAAADDYEDIMEAILRKPNVEGGTGGGGNDGNRDRDVVAKSAAGGRGRKKKPKLR